jgi:hypothetical protein
MRPSAATSAAVEQAAHVLRTAFRRAEARNNTENTTSQREEEHV